MGLRTDLEQSVRRALTSAGREYYIHLSSMLSDARRLGLIMGSELDCSFDYWHIPYQGEKLIEHYGYHYNGMMNRSFPGIHPMTVYDLNDGCFILITPPFNCTRDMTASEAISLCEDRLEFRIGSMIGDRGVGSIELTRRLAGEEQRVKPMIYYLAIKANSILRKHVRGRGWVTDEETGERACIRKGLDYHGVKTNLIALSKEDRRNPGKRRRIFLFITKDESKNPFDVLQHYRMRGEHERNLGCFSALGVKHLPSTESDEEIAGHLLIFMKLQFLFKLLMKRLEIGKCEPKTLSNLLLRKPGISWIERAPDGKVCHRTIIFTNRALIKKIGKTTLDLNGHEITLIEQWRSSKARAR